MSRITSEPAEDDANTANKLEALSLYGMDRISGSKNVDLFLVRSIGYWPYDTVYGQRPAIVCVLDFCYKAVGLRQRGAAAQGFGTIALIVTLP